MTPHGYGLELGSIQGGSGQHMVPTPEEIVTEPDVDEPSARIEHQHVDGGIDFHLEAHHLNQNPLRFNYEVEKDIVIEEEDNESCEVAGKEGIEIDDDIEIEIEDLEEDEQVVLFIEYKYCSVCHIEQPLRCKHCKTCEQCVATHDHHCPWIGNCVGERNRLWFFWFLQFQFA